MSRIEEFSLPSNAAGRQLHGFRCIPEGPVRAVLQLSHGMVEFIGRYYPLAEYLADQGILVTGHDHLGHGESIRTKEDYGYFEEPDGNKTVLEDLHRMTVLTKSSIRGFLIFCWATVWVRFMPGSTCVSMAMSWTALLSWAPASSPSSWYVLRGDCAAPWPLYMAGTTAANL